MLPFFWPRCKTYNDPKMYLLIESRKQERERSLVLKVRKGTHRNGKYFFSFSNILMVLITILLYK